ncbi:beta-N-acetylhexosaminidase [Elongatibacter sediminis]|uniref:Beta-hexosaminidase n=1 Tax=Elongatibacter sediminis TaxID=3119006 RepID=A0AAW9R6T8_9GAMM
MAGPLLIGFNGESLEPRTRQWLRHPDVGGVVLFKRNFRDREQLGELIGAIRDASPQRPLICIDQEGGRVQRLQAGFTELPPLGTLGRMWEESPSRAADFAYRHGRVMASEMLAVGIDLSFAPVLDLNRGSSVIGDRAFAADPEVVIELGRAYLAGMHDAGMKTTGKHFPGHGSVRPDSHTEDVVDDRALEELEALDLRPFAELAGDLDALMIAHVVYPRIDSKPAGYSTRWLNDHLRGSMHYRGVILSDDLGMHAARVAGDLASRTRACLEAGCDLVLVCRPEDVEELLGALEGGKALGDADTARSALFGAPTLSAAELASASSGGAGEWRQWCASLEALNHPRSSTGV